MNGILAIANTAFCLSSEVIHEVEESLTGARSFKLLLDRGPVVIAALSCLITTISAVALAIIGAMPMAAIMGVAALGCAFLTFYVSEMVSKKNLEETVDQAGRVTDDLSQQNRILQKQLDELSQTRKELETKISSLQAANEQSQKENAGKIQELKQALVDMQKICDSEKATDTQVGEMEKTTRELERVRESLQKQLAQAKAQDEERKKDVSAKIAQIDALTKQLTAVNQQREAMQGILQGINQATDRFSQQLSSVKPDSLAPGVMEMTQEMKSLSLSEEALGAKASELGESAALISKVQVSLNKMLEQVVTVLSATTDDQSKGKKYTDSLKQENAKLSTNVAALESEMQRLEKMNVQLVEANKKLSELAEILKRPDIAQIIQRAIAQAKEKN